MKIINYLLSSLVLLACSTAVFAQKYKSGHAEKLGD